MKAVDRLEASLERLWMYMAWVPPAGIAWTPTTTASTGAATFEADAEPIVIGIGFCDACGMIHPEDDLSAGKVRRYCPRPNCKWDSLRQDEVACWRCGNRALACEVKP